MNNRSMPPGTFIPELVYADFEAAIAWLCQAFGFQERLRIADHRCQLVFGEGSVVVMAGSGAGAPAATELTHAVMVRVPDVDRHCEHAAQNGARILRPPETYPF